MKIAVWGNGVHAKMTCVRAIAHGNTVVTRVSDLDNPTVDLPGLSFCKPGELKNYDFDKIIVSLATRRLRQQAKTKHPPPPPGGGGAISVGKIIDEGIERFAARIFSFCVFSEHAKAHKLSGQIAAAGVISVDYIRKINWLMPEKKIYLFPSDELIDDNNIVHFDSFANYLSTMTKPEQIVLCKSYDEVKNDEQFCFVYLASDEYPPVINGLRYFYPNLITGGIIALTDYDFPSCPHTNRAFDDYASEIGQPLQSVMYGDYNSVTILKYP
jgi:hypothetical protein